MKYKFYMQGVNKAGALIAGTLKNLETDFDGLRYHSINGVDKIGKPNVYTESFADSERMKVYIPKDVKHAPTSVELKLLFIGSVRRNTFDAFVSYITNGIHRYWDDARKKEFDFFVKDEINVSSDKWKEGVPYMEATFKLTNIDGVTKDHVF